MFRNDKIYGSVLQYKHETINYSNYNIVVFKIIATTYLPTYLSKKNYTNGSYTVHNENHIIIHINTSELINYQNFSIHVYFIFYN